MADNATPNPAEQPNEATPPIDLTAIVQTVTEQVTAALKPQLDELATNQQTLADTLAKLPPADEQTIQSIVDARLAAAQQQQAESDTARQQREAKVGELINTRLGGLTELGRFITATDDAGIEEQVTALADVAKKLKPDVGGPAPQAPAPGGAADKSFRSLLK